MAVFGGVLNFGGKLPWGAKLRDTLNFDPFSFEGDAETFFGRSDKVRIATIITFGDPVNLRLSV